MKYYSKLELKRTLKTLSAICIIIPFTCIFINFIGDIKPENPHYWPIILSLIVFSGILFYIQTKIKLNDDKNKKNVNLNYK